MSGALAIGIDLGGSRLKCALVDGGGRLVRFDVRPAGTGVGGEGPLEAIVAAVADLARSEPGPVVGVGLGVPGAIDPERGALVGSTPHVPGWVDFPVRDTVAARVGLPVLVDNDANFAALAEQRKGAACGRRVVLVLTVGTGVGCGIVADGRVFRGGWGGAGELGHLPVGSGEIACACGVPRCIEPEISGEGMARYAAARGLPWREPPAIFAAAEQGETAARALVGQMAEGLGRVIAIGVQILNPEVVVIGGGVAEEGEALLAPVRSAARRHTLAPLRRGLAIVPAAFGERAGAVGAALAAWDAARIGPGDVASD